MIKIKTKKQIDIMRQGGRILAEIMKELEKRVEIGVKTKELDRVAQALILKYGVEPGFKGYHGFPAALCVSINSMVVHAVPNNYALQDGDIVSLDLGLLYKGYYADMAVTIPVGNVDFETLRLIKVTKKALKLGINKAKIGNTFGDIGNTIQRFVEDQGFNVVRELCGHGIGTELHEDPQILNYSKRHKGDEIKQGMVFCIEPMVTIGDWKLKKADDGFGYETKDGSLSAHFEHTIAVTNRTQVLTS